MLLHKPDKPINRGILGISTAAVPYSAHRQKARVRKENMVCSYLGYGSLLSVREMMDLLLPAELVPQWVKLSRDVACGRRKGEQRRESGVI